MMEQLRAFIEAFVLKRCQQSWLNELAKSRQQGTIVRGMDALWRELDERYCTLLPKGNLNQNIAFIHQYIRQHKLKNCFIMSADDTFNQLTLPIEQALALVVGSSSTTIVSFVPGQLAYFEGHSVGERYMCSR